MSVELVEPLPWTYTDSPGVLLWTWLTPHFVARITGAEVIDEDAATDDGRRLIRSYMWDVSDLVRTSQGLPRPLVSGTSADFDAAELMIREHVGKCYDPRLGYRKFAGPLAYTFMLSTGETVDVSEFIGTKCAVTVLMPDRTERTVTGDFEVTHYKWRIAAPDRVMEIVPEHVVRITNRSEAAERATQIIRSDLFSGIGRMYKEDPRPGCTGRAGFLMGTVDHAGAHRCPVHEAGLPEHLLR